MNLPRGRGYGGNIALVALVALTLGAAAVSPVRADPAFSRELASQLEAGTASPAERVSLIDFYTQRDWAPLWSGDEAAHERVKAALDAIGRAAEHGLEPSAYAEASLSALAGRTDVEGKAELEWQLSLQVLRYARDLGFGHLAVDRDAFDVPVSAAIFAPELVLGGLATTPSPAAFLAGLAPVDGGYERLQALLASLRQQRDAGGWPHVPENETLKLGSTGAAVRALRDRLNVSGDLPATATIAGQHDRTAPNRPAASFDVTLERAVRAFQRRNGLEEDGVAGPATLQALNVSVGARLAQVAVNLERLRQGRRDLGQRYVLINVPDYHLTYVDGRGATPVHYESRVVVGTLRDQTPTFTGTMTYLDLNPSWYVPKSIAVREFLPKLRADPSYLERNNYALYAGGTAVDPWAVDWASVGRGDFPYRIRQLPGSDNALGRVKFMFPNKYKRLHPRHAVEEPVRARAADLQSRLRSPGRTVPLGGASAPRPGLGHRPDRGCGRARQDAEGDAC